MKEHELLRRIVTDPKVMVGKPVIRGTRLTVQHILGLLAQGMTADEIVAEYKTLSKEDVFACLIFAREALESSTFTSLSV